MKKRTHAYAQTDKCYEKPEDADLQKCRARHTRGGDATPFAKGAAESACLGMTQSQSDFSHIRAGLAEEAACVGVTHLFE